MRILHSISSPGFSTGSSSAVGQHKTASSSCLVPRSFTGGLASTHQPCRTTVKVEGSRRIAQTPLDATAVKLTSQPDDSVLPILTRPPLSGFRFLRVVVRNLETTRAVQIVRNLGACNLHRSCMKVQTSPKRSLFPPTEFLIAITRSEISTEITAPNVL